MARGHAALWSTILAAPFVVGGTYVYKRNPSATVPDEVGLPILAFGVFVLAVGGYVHFVAAPSPPTMRAGEKLRDSRTPARRAAIAKLVVGFSFLLIAGYLLFLTLIPYVYPIGMFVVGLYFFSVGLFIYWTNSLTTYYVTNKRLIKEYRFVSLVRRELLFEKVRGVEERKSMWEAVIGLGNVRVASGGSCALEITVRNIRFPNEFADEIRSLV